MSNGHGNQLQYNWKATGQVTAKLLRETLKPTTLTDNDAILAREEMNE
jgi:hypothetical protein